MINTKNRLFWLIPVIAVLLALALGFGLLGGGGPSKKWQKQYDLGIQYLSSMDYEQAILAFTDAIAMDERQPDAWLARGDAHLAAGDFAAARADYTQAAALGLDLAAAPAQPDAADAMVAQVLAAIDPPNQKGLWLDDDLRALLETAVLRFPQRVRRSAVRNQDGTERDTPHFTVYDTPEYASIAYHFRGPDEGYPLNDISYHQDRQVASLSVHLGRNAAGEMSYSGYHITEFVKENYIILRYYDENNLLENIYYEDRTDPAGRRQRREWYPDGVLKEITDAVYDADDNLLTEHYYDANGALTRIWYYNDLGKVARQEQYAPDGSLNTYLINEYNSAGERVSTSYYFPDGTLFYRDER